MLKGKRRHRDQAEREPPARKNPIRSFPPNDETRDAEDRSRSFPSYDSSILARQCTARSDYEGQRLRMSVAPIPHRCCRLQQLVVVSDHLDRGAVEGLDVGEDLACDAGRSDRLAGQDA